jgi:hypothetical protein
MNSFIRAFAAKVKVKELRKPQNILEIQINLFRDAIALFLEKL